MNRKLAIAGIGIVLFITAVLGSFIPRLQFNYVFEDFFPTDDPDLEVYKKFQENFRDDNNYLLIAFENSPSVFDQDFLYELVQITASLDSLKYTSKTSSILNTSIPLITPTGWITIPLIHVNEPSRYTSDSLRIFSNGWIPGSLIGTNAQSLLITIIHKSFTDKEKTDDYIKEVKNILDRSGKEYHIAGKIYAQHVYVNKMQQELVVFLSLSVLLVIIFLILTYRSLWGVLVPLLVVGLSIVWLAGFMAITGKSLDLLMVLMPTILFVVGMSDVVHILSRFLEELRNGRNKIVALNITIREIGLATFLTSLTTAVGFLTLMTASIKPVREFGLYLAAGVFFAYIIAFALLPSILYFIKIPAIALKDKEKKLWIKYLSFSFLKVFHYRKPIIIFSVILIILSTAGISMIRINTYLIDDLPDDNPLKKDFSFFDENYGGSRPLEAVITVMDSSHSIFNQNIINEVIKAENIISASLPATYLVSPAFMIRSLNQALHSGNAAYFIIPQDSLGWNAIRKYQNRLSRRPEVERLVTKNQLQGRITGRMDDIGSSITLQQLEEIDTRIKNEINSNLVSVKLTGSSFLIDKNNQYLVENMLKGLAIAFGIVALLAGLMFRSLKMIFIALIPNILPLLIVAGIMGISGISLKLSTSIIFTIAFGIAVDDTLHLLSKLRLEMAKGKGLLYALKRSYLSTGKAIVVTTLILSGGFLILLFSSFGGTFYTGLLVGITLILALIIDLTLLPVLILMLGKNKI